MTTRALQWFTATMTKSSPTKRSDIEAAVAQLGAIPPDDYVALMSETNGAEGPVGDAGYLVLWSTNRLAELNDAYGVLEFAPDLVLFGSDGGDTAFAFDRRAPRRIVAVPFVGMGPDETREIGKSLSDLLQFIAAMERPMNT